MLKTIELSEGRKVIVKLIGPSMFPKWGMAERRIRFEEMRRIATLRREFTKHEMPEIYPEPAKRFEMVVGDGDDAEVWKVEEISDGVLQRIPDDAPLGERIGLVTPDFAESMLEHNRQCLRDVIHRVEGFGALDEEQDPAALVEGLEQKCIEFPRVLREAQGVQALTSEERFRSAGGGDVGPGSGGATESD